MSKALAIVGKDTFASESGDDAWKADILDQLAKTQKVDGSWTNPEPRWMEGDPNLVTAYALLTLAHLKGN